jgi:hypothetical protein
MKKMPSWILAAVIIAPLALPATSIAGTEDEEKKVFAELSALIPKDRVATVDIYK